MAGLNGDASGSLVFSKAPIDVDTHSTNPARVPVARICMGGKSPRSSQARRPSCAHHAGCCGSKTLAALAEANA